MWPTPTPLPYIPPPHEINLDFQLNQDVAYTAIQTLNQLSGDGVGIQIVQFALIGLIVLGGLVAIIAALRDDL